MNRQFAISVVVLFVVSLMTGFVVHALLLQPDYAALPQMYRSDEDSAGYLQWMLLAHLLIGLGVTWVYRKGREDGPWLGQGLRFGAALALLTTVPGYLIYYAVQPSPGMLVLKQIVFSTAAILVVGVAAAVLNRK